MRARSARVWAWLRRNGGAEELSRGGTRPGQVAAGQVGVAELSAATENEARVLVAVASWLWWLGMAGRQSKREEHWVCSGLGGDGEVAGKCTAGLEFLAASLMDRAEELGLGVATPWPGQDGLSGIDGDGVLMRRPRLGDG
ncbi:hypothetical protein M0R45_002133 [Rubus argutus]|uniref:Uncharacterized protein n=1 Tax=Rubus argutus TaxID=59490 RepID=A0AAW1VJU0_RUBAR